LWKFPKNPIDIVKQIIPNKYYNFGGNAILEIIVAIIKLVMGLIENNNAII